MMPLAAAVGSGVPRWLKAGEDRLEPGLQGGGQGGRGRDDDAAGSSSGERGAAVAEGRGGQARARPARAARHMENK